ncbi:MAG: hypothetical protein ACRDRT_14085, partial [Pseudonocardiaceae bacterium]
VELVGEYQNSGLIESPWLVRRPDGRMIEISELLYRVAEEFQGSDSITEVANAVSIAVGRRLSDDNVRFLIETKLAPLGVLVEAGDPEGVCPTDPQAPLLAMVRHSRVLPRRAVDALANLFQPLFCPAIVAFVLVALAVVDTWLVMRGDPVSGVLEVSRSLEFFVALTALLLLSMAFHEVGHAAACRYGGAQPGAIGVGLYLLWPAFYADVTDSYRLDRRGRLRTDLGGLYFNAVFVLATAATYAVTGWRWLTLAVLLQHLQAVVQLFPFLRLDGYYVVSDITGVPNLFGRIRPIIRSVFSRNLQDPRVVGLKPWTRRVVAGWVALSLAMLGVVLYFVAKGTPEYAATIWSANSYVFDELVRATLNLEILTAAGRLVQLFVLA